ncbi:unnamed protein product, partial [Cylicostephanus goldi]
FSYFYFSSSAQNGYSGSSRPKPQRDSNASIPTAKQETDGNTFSRRTSREQTSIPTKPGRNSTASEDSAGSPTKQNCQNTIEIKQEIRKSPLAKLRNPLRKLMHRGQAKKSGGAYEKRLSLEIKAAKTVAIVTGCFIFCWLGFSLLYGLELQTNDVIWSVLFWLGYLNSALNPVIYTVFNREFRTCFKRLLTCHHLNHPNTNKVRDIQIVSLQTYCYQVKR